MWKIFNSNKSDVLQKTQENVELLQQNNQVLMKVLDELMPEKKPSENERLQKTEEEKLRAAYALNLCTVSVSQIIDYNDIQLLETEYDAILNNLNLEKMPKDEALLRILKQLLDVITFFRIQEGDKKLMEEQYAQRMKDAIWSAIPNPSVIVTGGNLIGIGLALASQVGIGYMNYRKEKAKITSDKKRDEWKLQRSAMEQFNGLRRELFDTAWRLADEYDFPDEYRLTERQITQFNKILMDENNLRKYERLDYIKDTFKAYPPFWYYLGNAANSVSLDEQYADTVKDEYKKRAIAHFNYFLQMTEQNLLREDQLIASCALEKFDLIDDKDEQLSLLEKAAKVSGNAFDVLQICAISYLKIGETDKACDLLRMLINENYNEILNAQLLSKLYVSQIMEGKESARDKYETLALRVTTPQSLFPLPSSDNKDPKEEFISAQKDKLISSHEHALILYAKKCERKYNDICMMQGNIVSEISAYMEDMSSSIGMLLDGIYSFQILYKINEEIEKHEECINNMVVSSGERSRDKVEFNQLFSTAFEFIASECKDYINKLEDMKGISETESSLYNFLISNNLTENDISAFSECTMPKENKGIFDHNLQEKLEKSQKVDQMLKKIKDSGYNSNKKPVSEELFIIRGDSRFAPYLKRNQGTYQKAGVDDDDIIAILNDDEFKDHDLIFTISHIIVTGWFNVKDMAEYQKVKFIDGGQTLQINNFEYKQYKHKKVNFDNLREMIKELKQLSDATDSNSVTNVIKNAMS